MHRMLIGSRSWSRLLVVNSCGRGARSYIFSIETVIELRLRWLVGSTQIHVIETNLALMRLATGNIIR